MTESDVTVKPKSILGGSSPRFAKTGSGAKKHVPTQSKTMAAKRPQESVGEEPLLVAALAATLVAYQRHVEQRNGSLPVQSTGITWQTMARWQQLAQTAPPQKRG